MNASNLFYPISGLVNAVTSIVLGLFVLGKNRFTEKYITYVFFCFSVAVWSIFYFYWMVSTEKGQALAASRALMAGAVFIPIFYLHHVLVLLERRKEKERILGACYIFGLVSVSLAFHPSYIQGVTSRLGFKYWPVPGPLYNIFLFFWVLIVLYGVFMILQELKEAQGLKKSRIKYLLIATLIGWGGGITNYFLWYGIPVLPVGNILVSAYVIIATYAIIRYRLLGIHIAATRAVVFSLVYLPIVAIPFSIGYYFDSYFLSKFGFNSWFLSTVIAIILAPSGIKVYQYLTSRAERSINHKKLESLKNISEFLENIKKIRTLGELLELILEKTSQIVRISPVQLFLFDQSSQRFILRTQRNPDDGGAASPGIKEFPKDDPIISIMLKFGGPLIKDELLFQMENVQYENTKQVIKEMERIKAGVIIPAFHQDELVAFMLLGESLSHPVYDDEVIENLRVLGVNAGLAIKNALYLQDMKNLNSDLIASERLAAIGRLATSTKHEISNPLNMVYGSFQRVMMDLKDKGRGYPRAVKSLESAASETDRLLSGVLKSCYADFKDLAGLYRHAAEIIKDSPEKLSPRVSAEELRGVLARMDIFKVKLEEIPFDSEKSEDAKKELLHLTGTSRKHIEKVIEFDNITYDIIDKGFRNASRIAQAVNAIYHLPKGLETDVDSIEIRKLVDESLDFTGYQSYWENLSDTRIEKIIPEDLPRIKGHFNRLVSVFSNLFINAYQAMTEAEINFSDDRVIRIKAVYSEEDPDMVEIKVSNRGPLIPEDKLEKIFRQGYTSKRGNKGLGLDICRTQVEVFNGGEIFVNNIEGFGPEFTVRLPVWE